jgi:hypothetical protein
MFVQQNTNFALLLRKRYSLFILGQLNKTIIWV